MCAFAACYLHNYLAVRVNPREKLTSLVLISYKEKNISGLLEDLLCQVLSDQSEKRL